MRNGVRIWLAAGAANGALAVLAGAFAAHGLEGALPPERLSAFETGARLHLPHAAALLGVAFAAHLLGGRLVRAAGWLLLAGIVLFSGSLYAYALTALTPLVFVTPLGGVLLVAGWSLLALAALQSPQRSELAPPGEDR